MAAIATGGATTVLSRSLETRPSTQISASWSLTRQQDGEQIYWMAVVLAAMLCGIGRKAEGFAPGVAATNSVGSQGSPMALASLPTGKNPVRSFIPVVRISDMLLNRQRLRYPDILLVYWVGDNPFHHHQDLNRLRRAWQKVETVILHKPHWTALARHADIVLPATLSAVLNDLTGTPRDTHLFATGTVSRRPARRGTTTIILRPWQPAFPRLRSLHDKTRSGSNSRPDMPD
jgi:biotin/methionine sulfoxide reductase